jgi:L-threonylcarbamoyladenylate synthase
VQVMSNSPFISNCTADAIRNAALALKAGHLVAFPTETVYGLGADARNPDAIKRIYEVKGRPTDHPLIVHISSINQLDKWAVEIPDYAIELSRAFWPGPMTLILKRTDIVKNFITGGQDTVGLRVPSDPIALALITEFERISGSAIAAPSANRFGQVSPTSSADVQEEIGFYLRDGDLVLEGGRSEIGIESTIIDCRNETPSLLRPGAVTEEMIAKIQRVSQTSEQNSLRVSGALAKHYAPAARILLNTEPTKGQAFLAMSGIRTPLGVHRVFSPTTVEEFAQNLYFAMRETDRLGIKELVIHTPRGDGLAQAILDRVNKSAGGR